MTSLHRFLTQSGQALVDMVDNKGRIIQCEPIQAEALGYTEAALTGANWSMIYPAATRRHISSLLSGRTVGPVPAMLHVRDADGLLTEMAAIIDVISDPTHGRCARLFKWIQADFIANAEQLQDDMEILADIIAASNDPGWCIEYTQPVDLSAPEQEIIRQMFDNQRRWRFCNAAMARFYHFPEEQDLNARSVDEIFPLNPENEEFAKLLIRSNFDVVGAPSLDVRYDGVAQVVENDVRGHIRNNSLHRMWGTVRDVSKHHRKAEQLRRQITDLELFLSVVPDAFVLLDEKGGVVHANDQALALFGRSHAQIEDFSYDHLVSDDATISSLHTALEASATGLLRRPVQAAIHHPDGPIPVELNARLFENKGRANIAISFRAMASQAAVARTFGQEASS